MWPDRVSNMGPLGDVSDALATAPRSLADYIGIKFIQAKVGGSYLEYEYDLLYRGVEKGPLITHSLSPSIYV